MEILITDRAGSIGSHLIEKLLKKYPDVKIGKYKWIENER